MARPPNQKYYGSTVVGEKGQIVVPAEARKAFNLSPGDKVMVFGHQFHGTILMMRADVVAEYVSRGLDQFGELARVLKEEDTSEESEAGPRPAAPVISDTVE
jgi:AbrB family looped-hinge helix DNA binding protein